MGGSSEISEVLAEVGPRLRRVRTQRDVTLTELAAATGISKSALQPSVMSTEPGSMWSPVPGGTLTPEQLKALVRYLRDIVACWPTDADPADKAELYNELGVSLTYHHADGRVAVEAMPRGADVRVGGGT